MKSERIIAYILIAIGALALLINIGVGTAWLWVGIAAITFLVVYASQRHYSFLVLGSILAGAAVGILMEAAWGLSGAFFVSLGIGFLAIDRIEPRPNRWPLYIAAVLIAFGVLVGLLQTGILSSIWFGVLLVAIGIYLLYRDQEPSSNDGWVETSAPASESATAAAPAIPVTRPTPFHEPAPAETTLGEAAQREVPKEREVPKVRVTRETVPVTNSTATSAHTPARTTPLASEAELEAETDRVTMSPEAQERYRRLERWRKTTAAKDGTPAYIVLRNETLEQLATENPQTLDELKEIKGIGPVKLERYGGEILAVLRGDAPPQTT